MNKFKNNILLLVSLTVLSMASLAVGANAPENYSMVRLVAEKNTPVYADGYAKNVKGKLYGLEIQNGYFVPPIYNLGSTSRKSFDGNKLLGYFQPGTAIALYVDGSLRGDYPLADTFDRTIDIGNAKVTLKFQLKELPILPAPTMLRDDSSFYQNGKVYFVTMDILPLSSTAEETKEKESSEWFSPSLRYDYVQQVKALKDKYLAGVDLHKLTEPQLEDLARKMSAERRELGKKFKAATPEYFRKSIYQRNIEKYGDQYGPTISYLRNVQGKTWKQIIQSSSEPGGSDVWGTGLSYKLGELKHWWYGSHDQSSGSRKSQL